MFIYWVDTPISNPTHFCVPFRQGCFLWTTTLGIIYRLITLCHWLHSRLGTNWSTIMHFIVIVHHMVNNISHFYVSNQQIFSRIRSWKRYMMLVSNYIVQRITLSMIKDSIYTSSIFLFLNKRKICIPKQNPIRYPIKVQYLHVTKMKSFTIPKTRKMGNSSLQSSPCRFTPP